MSQKRGKSRQIRENKGKSDNSVGRVNFSVSVGRFSHVFVRSDFDASLTMHRPRCIAARNGVTPLSEITGFRHGPFQATPTLITQIRRG